MQRAQQVGEIRCGIVQRIGQPGKVRGQPGGQLQRNAPGRGPARCLLVPVSQQRRPRWTMSGIGDESGSATPLPGTPPTLPLDRCSTSRFG